MKSTIETSYNSSRMTRTITLDDGRKIKYARTGLDDVLTHRRQIFDSEGKPVHTDVLSRESGDWTLITASMSGATFRALDEEQVDAIEHQWFNYTIEEAVAAANNPAIDLDALTI